jgi:hypothetical protein
VPRDRAILPETQFVSHEPWQDENGPGHHMYAGQAPFEQGEQYVAKYGGAPRQPLADTYTGYYCGDSDQWAGELLSYRPGDLGEVGCCSEIPPVAEASWWAETTACTVSDPIYAHREVTVSGIDGTSTVLPDGRSGTLVDGPAWEGNRQFGVPNGSIVRMWHGSDGAGFFFARGNLLSEVLLAESTPTGPDGLFDANVAVWDSAEHPGIFAPADESCWALNLAGGDVTDPGPHHGRYLGRASGRALYAFRPSDGGGGSACADCNVVPVGAADIGDVDVGDHPDGTHVYIPNLLTGAVGHWVALTIGGTRGWIDLCTCTESWWCTPAGCVPSAGMPAGAVSGPYISAACCDDDCTPTACCPGEGEPAFPPDEVVSLHSSGACACADSAEGPANSPDGSSVLGSVTGFCGEGMLTFNGLVYCTDASLGMHGWAMDWDVSDAEHPSCGGSGTAAVLIDGTHGFSCNPLDMWFRITDFPGLCCGGADEPTVMDVHWTGDFVPPMAPMLALADAPQPARPAAPAARPLPLVSDCIHLGEQTRQTAPCAGCGNGTVLRVHQCHLLGACTIDMRPGKAVLGIRSCGDCARHGEGYSPRPKES